MGAPLSRCDGMRGGLCKYALMCLCCKQHHGLLGSVCAEGWVYHWHHGAAPRHSIMALYLLRDGCAIGQMGCWTAIPQLCAACST
eukprot:scaffold40159_cov41-Tisochrysis_lutea.AAC.2